MLSHDLNSLAAEFEQRAAAVAPETLSPVDAGIIAANLRACVEYAELMEAACVTLEADADDPETLRRSLAVTATWGA